MSKYFRNNCVTVNLFDAINRNVKMFYEYLPMQSKHMRVGGST